jgi:hypothetical protein
MKRGRPAADLGLWAAPLSIARREISYESAISKTISCAG